MSSFDVRIFSSLAKVFSDEEPKYKEITGQTALRNEKTSFQVSFKSDEDMNLELRIGSDLKDALKVYNVVEINSCSAAYAKQDDYTLRREVSDYPDLLTPNDGTIIVKGGKWQSLWFEISSEHLIDSGVHDIEISFAQNDAVVSSVKFTLEIIDALLPEQTLIFTNWFHTDCLATYYKVEVFSDEYWRIVENYLKIAREYGMNAVLTPLFTPPLDTKIGGERPTVQLVDVTKTENGYEFGFDKLEQWIAMCDRVGIKYLEMTHFFTQWGAKHAPKIVANVKGEQKKIFGWRTRAAGRKYGAFLDAFAQQLKRFIADKGISERCFFHVSDEPNKAFLRHYKKASAIVQRNFGNFPIVDALSDFDFYSKGLIKLPIPANNHIEPFIGNVDELWTYYCCAQNNKYVANRFFNMPSQRNRILGYQLYKYNVKGFLHWGFNYWFTQYSLKAIDPYKVTDAGGAFAAGDSFVVYPGADGKPLSSLRLKVFYDAFQDMRALQLLESLTDRETALSIIDDKGDLTFSNYPHSDEWQLQTRERINRAIANAVKKA